jgi:DNA-binding response OmpR family regulator
LSSLEERKGAIRMERQAKILLVDDDIDFVEATKIVLESKYQVIVAYEGDEGLRKAREENPDLIILDIIMPVKDGFTAAEHLKRDPQLSQTPVLMLTAFSQKYKETSIPVSRGFTLEAEDYVEKPVSPEELLARVDKLLQK